VVRAPDGRRRRVRRRAWAGSRAPRAPRGAVAVSGAAGAASGRSIAQDRGVGDENADILLNFEFC